MTKETGIKRQARTKTEIEQEIASLEFYRDNYIKSAKTTIGYAVPQTCGILNVARHLCSAITQLESAEVLIDRHIGKLRAKSAMKEDKQ